MLWWWFNKFCDLALRLFRLYRDVKSFFSIGAHAISGTKYGWLCIKLNIKRTSKFNIHSQEDLVFHLHNPPKRAVALGCLRPIEQFHTMVDSVKPDGIVGTESWLRPNSAALYTFPEITCTCKYNTFIGAFLSLCSQIVMYLHIISS